MRIRCLFLILVSFFFFNRVQSIIKQTSSLSQLLLGEGATLASEVPFVDLKGQLVMSQGSVIVGNNIIFANGSINSLNGTTIQINGSFNVDTSTSPLLMNFLGNNQISFFDTNKLKLSANIPLRNTWEFTGNAVIQGDSNIIDLSDPLAKIIIMPNSTLTLTNVSLQNFNLSKINFSDQSSTLNFIDSKISLDSSITATVGNFIFKGHSELKLNDHDILFSDVATFTVEQNASIWLDNTGSENDPILSLVITDTTPTGFHLFSYIDNSKIRILSDRSQVLDPGLTSLVSGFFTPIEDPANADPGAGAQVDLTANTNLGTDSVIVVQNNVEINGNGSSVTFSNTGLPQFTVDPGKTATFGNVELLRINQHTFDLKNDSTIRFKDNAVLEFIEDVRYDAGAFLIIGTSGHVLMRGLGGRKKITLTSSLTGSASFSIGSNELVLEDIEISGLQYFFKGSALVDGQLKEGKITLTGQSKINVDFDSNMNFLIRGESTRIVFQKNNLSLTGKIRFDDFSDSALHVFVNANSDNEDLVFKLDKDTMLLSSKEGVCGLIIDNDKASLVNKTSTSFAVKTKSFLGGGSLKIKENPILQETPSFSLNPGLEITSDLANPIDIAGIPPLEETRMDESIFRFEGKSTRAIAIPRALITVKTGLFGKDLYKTIAVNQNAVINSFSSSETKPLNLILAGGASVQTKIRRSAKLSAQVLRDLTLTGTTDATIDKIKATDIVYVKGQNNKILITGLLDFSGKIVMDEQAELVFKFDDSVDSEKGIRFTSDYSGFLQNLPPSSSIVFDGDGQVFFSDGSLITFNGSAIEDLTPIGNGFFEDDRPSLIFRNYAQMVFDTGNSLTLKGRGKLVFQNSATGNFAQGLINLGDSDTDFFDLVANNNAVIKIGNILEQPSSDIIASLSLSQGLFNCKFTQNSSLSIRNGGLFEIGLLAGEFKGGALSEGIFNKNSKVTILQQGIWAFGQKDFTEAGETASRCSWDNSDSSFSGNGVLAMFTGNSGEAFVAARLQNNQVFEESIGLFSLFKSLVRVTDTLITAADFSDINKDSKLLTPKNIIVSLQEGDVVRREGPDNGYVYGTSLTGQRFAILPDGTRQIFS